MLDYGVAEYCDRSPCSSLLQALGRWIFGNQNGGYTAVTGRVDHGNIRHLDEIHYCPFCGTRLDQLELSGVEVVDVHTAPLDS